MLLKGVTDSLEDARALHALTKNWPCKINIIPFNEHPESGFHRPDEDTIIRFQNELIRLGSHVLRRKQWQRHLCSLRSVNDGGQESPPQLSLYPGALLLRVQF